MDAVTNFEQSRAWHIHPNDIHEPMNMKHLRVHHKYPSTAATNKKIEE